MAGELPAISQSVRYNGTRHLQVCSGDMSVWALDFRLEGNGSVSSYKGPGFRSCATGMKC